MKLYNALIFAGALALTLAAAPKAEAVPSLGVGSSYGYVNATDNYQTFWGSSVSGGQGQDGFVIGPSGSTLNVFSNILNADIYILTTSDVGIGNNILFNGSINVYGDTGTFRSYDPTPYYGINLGKVSNSTWTALPSNPFTPGTYFSSVVPITYTGDIGADSWIFAAADNNGLEGLQAKTTRVYSDTNGIAGIQTEGGEYWEESNGIGGVQYSKTQSSTGKGKWKWIPADNHIEYEADTFTGYQADSSSPKTTSARGYDVPSVPEPSTLILIGGGLALLGFYRKKARK